MKQPELGIKIAELRKSKGLTQEELVERCNISVRTIQRIETGEVMPRSYTIKAILTELDYDISQIADERKSSGEALASGIKRFFLLDLDHNKPSTFLIKQLNLAGIFGIIYFVIGFFEGAAEYYWYTDQTMIYSNSVYIIVKLISVVSFVFFQRGFIMIGEVFKNYLLKVMSFILIIALIMLSCYDIISIYYESVDGEFIGGASAITFGCIGIIYGIALLRLKGSVGRVSKYAGVLEIVAGSFLLTIILAFIGLIIYIPADIIEIIIVFKAIEIIKSKQKENIDAA